jgi:hypothetical protein
MFNTRREGRRAEHARRHAGSMFATSALALAALAAGGAGSASAAPNPFSAALAPIAFTGLTTTAAAVDPPADWAVTGTTARMELAFRAPALTTPLADFPVAVRLTPDRIDYASTNKDNLFFVDPSDPSSRLPYEVEKWTPGGESVVWVKAPHVADGGKIELYYGGTGVSAVDPHQVWDSASAAVYHFADASAPLTDSTGKTAAGTPHGGPTLGTGELGSGLALDGVDDNGDLGFPGDGSPSLTASAWVNVTPEMLSASASYSAILARDVYGGAAPGEVMFLGMYQGKLLTRFVVNGVIKQMGGSITAGWHQITTTYNGSNAYTYVDGQQVATIAATGTLGSSGNVPMTVGSYSNSEGFFPMTVDEARIATVARSADWIATEYLSDADKLLTYGLPETIGGALAMQVSEPTPNEQIAVSTVHLTGQTSKGGPVSYTLDGGAPVTVDHSGSSFDVVIDDLKTGSHTFVVSAAASDDATDKVTKTITFSVVGTASPAKPSDPAPADGAQVTGDSADLSVHVADPTSDPLDVTFHGVVDHALDASSDMATSGTLGGAPATALPTGGKAFSAGDYQAAARTDGAYATTTSQTDSVYQRYDVAVGTVPADQDTVAVHWRGHADHTVNLYAWNFQLARWTQVGTGFAAGAKDFDIDADIDAHTMVSDGKARLMAYRGIPANPLTARIPGPGDFDFSFAWMSDTQFYTESYPDYYTSMTQDVLDQKDARKTAYTFHLGDIVETWNVEQQWKNADASMKLLDDAGMPYGVLPGNHDNGSSPDDAHHVLYDKYFGEQRFTGKPWYGGDYKDNQDHYDLMTVGGVDFIMMYLGYAVDDDEIAWARNVLAQYPDRKAIVAMHDYQKPGGELSTDGADPKKLHDDLIMQSPNVFLTISGHLQGTGVKIEKLGDHNVTEVEADYQDGPLGGGGFYRYLQFDTQDGLLYINTTSPVTHQTQYFGDAADTLVFSVPLTTDSPRTLATDSVGVTTAGQEIGHVDDVASGDRASVTLHDLQPGTDQQWYATATDPSGNTVQSDTWSFTTPAAPGDGDGDGNPGDGGDQSPGDGGDQNPGDGGDQTPTGDNQTPAAGTPAPVVTVQPPSGATPVGGQGTPPVDRTAPKATGLKVVGKPAAHGSLQLALKLSEPAQMRVTLLRAVTGRKVGKLCKAQTKRSARGKVCTRWISAGTLTKQVASGSRTLKLALGSKPAGRYRATITLRDAAGNATKAQTLSFTVGKATKKH